MKKQLLALGAALLITTPQAHAASAAAAASTALMTVTVLSATAIMDLLTAIERNAPEHIKEIAAQLVAHKRAAAPRKFHADAPARQAPARRAPRVGAGHSKIQQPGRDSGR